MNRSESNTLDFKRDQYKFAGLPNDKTTAIIKSELLKDILAFANSRGSGERYILIGVEENKPPPHTLHSITAGEIDDAHLQQFLGKKVNRPLNFSYQELSYEGEVIGLITIKEQQRPFYLNKDYGRLSAGIVYVRRGSSTDIADPDEVYAMGVAAMEVDVKTPDLSVEFSPAGKDEWSADTLALRIERTSIGKQETVKPNLYLRTPRSFNDVNSSQININPSNKSNQELYAEYKSYIEAFTSITPVDLRTSNGGNVIARSVTVEVAFLINKIGINLMTKSGLPRQPSRDRAAVPSMHHLSTPISYVDDSGPTWSLRTTKSDIQAGRSEFQSEIVNIQCNESMKIDCNVFICSDDIEAPIESKLNIEIEVTDNEISYADFKKIVDSKIQ